MEFLDMVRNGCSYIDDPWHCMEENTKELIWNRGLCYCRSQVAVSNMSMLRKDGTTMSYVTRIGSSMMQSNSIITTYSGHMRRDRTPEHWEGKYAGCTCTCMNLDATEYLQMWPVQNQGYKSEAGRPSAALRNPRWFMDKCLHRSYCAAAFFQNNGNTAILCLRGQTVWNGYLGTYPDRYRS